MRMYFAFLACLLVSGTMMAQNVGIGTITPAAKLDVKSVSNYVGQFNGIAPMYIGIYENDIYRGYLGSYSGVAEDVDFGTGATNATGKLHFTIQASPRVTINATGNVGVGTVNPQARMEIFGSGTTSGTNTLVLRNSIGDTLFRMRDDGRIGIGYNGASFGRVMNLGGSGINFYTSNEAAFGGAVFPTDTSLIIWSNSNTNNYVVLQPSWGNVGVGTYTPNSKLHINGSALIGSNTSFPAPGYLLSVDGRIICEEARVQNSVAWPDYVFAEHYLLTPIEELEAIIKKQKHLPNMPAAATVEKEGFDLGGMNIKLLEKVEELTLYLIELKKENKILSERITKLEAKKN